MKAWWQNLQPRERMTLAAGALALAGILYYFILWQPAQQALETKRERLDNIREDTAWMRSAVQRYQRLSRDQGPAARNESDEALYALADRTARADQLGDAIGGVTPEDEGRVRVNLRGASFENVLRWLARLETEFGIHAEPVSVERTDETGMVNARLVLNQGGA